VSLFGVRLFNSFPWVSSLAVAGVFLSVLDIITHIWNDNPNSIIRNKGRYIACLSVGIIIEVMLIIFMIINIASPRKWMENALFSDEFTILALMLAVFQQSIITFINHIIQEQ
jgi:hypothetical protein